MSVKVRNALIGFAVVFIVSFVLGALGAGTSAGVLGMAVGFFTWYILSNLASNRKVANVSDGDRLAALSAPPPSGYGLVYVYREGFIGMAVGFDVALDGVTVAQLKSPRFTRLVVPAGSHSLAGGPKGFAGAQNKIGVTNFTLAAGETQVYRLKSQMGMLQNSVVVTPEPNPQAILPKFAAMTMVAPETSAATIPPPPPPNVLPR
jgi:hypothetical protein